MIVGIFNTYQPALKPSLLVEPFHHIAFFSDTIGYKAYISYTPRSGFINKGNIIKLCLRYLDLYVVAVSFQCRITFL